ncbi:hypothetical protein A0H81_02489 [Grifola frondosa]|uniref:Uncharacterized protein n=1 Tax=Grifola frondosa TaxID=5627 RepID=A0A1C7MMW4_GRIFR|nr:hypothetical protein A0H81_02489 [Grifola frondosa]
MRGFSISPSVYTALSLRLPRPLMNLCTSYMQESGGTLERTENPAIVRIGFVYNNCIACSNTTSSDIHLYPTMVVTDYRLSLCARQQCCRH